MTCVLEYEVSPKNVFIVSVPYFKAGGISQFGNQQDLAAWESGEWPWIEILAAYIMWPSTFCFYPTGNEYLTFRKARATKKKNRWYFSKKCSNKSYMMLFGSKQATASLLWQSSPI